ncbi:MAG: glycine cleavage system aminomethyltransferase GcvT [Betaproteobacteria bacterium]|nr:glycine cleavage system aminomethyltransferase GcvT [Betaproteobacteria bacterium]
MSDAKASAEADELQQTPLHELHLSLGARMVPFAGYSMPLQYAKGIVAEHRHTREAASLFDVSHMGQLHVRGEQAAAALESLVPVDLQGLARGRQRYGFLLDAGGGILDDLMITHRARSGAAGAGGEFFVVVNAARKQHDQDWLSGHLAARCEIEPMPRHALLALQGPAAAQALQSLMPAVAQLRFMDAAWVALPPSVGDAEVFVSRSGYTGEDGFEISVAAEHAQALAAALLKLPGVAPAGLGARDTLRLEAGLCLYGHDMDTTTTPVQARLQWAIQKVRRSGGARAGGFPGAEVVLAQLDDPARVGRVRVGLRGLQRAPVREGARLLDAQGREVGSVTSGALTPSADAAIAMAYVQTACATAGTELYALVRDKRLPMQVVDMPFVAHRYARG